VGLFYLLIKSDVMKKKNIKISKPVVKTINQDHIIQNKLDLTEKELIWLKVHDLHSGVFDKIFTCRSVAIIDAKDGKNIYFYQGKRVDKKMFRDLLSKKENNNSKECVNAVLIF